MIELLSNIVFGLADNGIMLIGALLGLSLEASLEKRAGNALIGALVGNAVSDGIAGLIAGNLSLALGSFIGCLIPLLVYILVKKLLPKSKDKQSSKRMYSSLVSLDAVFHYMYLNEADVVNLPMQDLYNTIKNTDIAFMLPNYERFFMSITNMNDERLSFKMKDGITLITINQTER